MTVSAVGIIAIVVRNLPRVRVFTCEEFHENFAAIPAVHHKFFANFIIPACLGAHNFCIPRLLAVFERVARRGRIITLRMETRLHLAANYLKGKRELSTPNVNGKNAKYWTNVAESKGSAVDEVTKED